MAEAIIISALLPLVFEKSADLIERHLGIVIGADVEKELINLQNTLKTIQAVLEDAEERQVTENALKLWLSNLKDTAYLADDLLEDLNLDVLEGKTEAREHHPLVAKLWQLPKLEVLEVGGMEHVKQIGGKEFYGDNGREVFPSLRRLKLYGMPNLEEWSGVEQGRTCFPRTTEIEIIDCPKLRIVPAIRSIRSLQIQNCPLLRPSDGFFGCLIFLERLDMDSCDKMVLMLEQDDKPGGPLVYLQIKNCNELMFSSPSLGMWKHFNSLQTLNFKSCDGINILPLHLFQGMTSLKTLLIHCCDSMTGSFRDEGEGLSFQGLTALEELDIQVCTGFPCFHPEGLKHLNALKLLRIYSNHGLTELPDFPDSVRVVIFYNNWNLLSLPAGLGRLTSLENLTILNLHEITSLPDEIQGYKALKSLKIEDCPRVTELPLGLQQRLPSLNYLEIKQCPILARQCSLGGEYYKLVSRIPIKYIGDS